MISSRPTRMSAALVAALVVVVLAAKSGDVHGVPVRQTESVEPSEFLVKFQSQRKAMAAQRQAQGKMQGRKIDPSPADELRAWHASSGIASGNSATSQEEDELSYRIMQTIKGSYSAIGPLQCESVCHVKKGQPNCPVDIPDCAMECADRCEAGTNEVELKEKLCIEGCTLFCGVHPTAGAGGFLPEKRGIKRETD